MMRSLWSGVSGLNAQQVAMDVEGNNIANVNTVGFKYSRVNFENLLSQTVRSATAPQGTLGGKNPLQIGLGATVSSVETIFKQGSIQNTGKNTDMAINGRGFFVVSGDGGKTYKYTRAGDFTFDANGDLVNPDGYIVQGWLADPNTHTIDTASGVKPISIPPGLTTPAHSTSKIHIKANLNSGSHITEMSGTRATVDPSDNMNGLYDANGDKIKLTPGDDHVTFKVVNLKGDTVTLNLTYGNTDSTHTKFETLEDLINDINYKITHDSNGNYINPGNERSTNYLVYLNGDGQIVDPRGDGVTFVSATDAGGENKVLTNIFQAINGPSKTTGTIKAIKNSFIGADDVGELFNANGDAFNLQAGEGIQVSIQGLHENRKFVYEPKKNDSSSCGVNNSSYLGKPVVTDSNEGMHWLYATDGKRATLSINDSNNTHNRVYIKITDTALKDTLQINALYGKDFYTISDLVCDLNTQIAKDSNLSGKISFTFSDGRIKANITDSNVKIKQADAYKDSTSTQTVSVMDSIIKNLTTSQHETLQMMKRDTYYFHNIEDLVHIWQLALDDANNPLNDANANKNAPKGIVSLHDGKLEIKNTSPSSYKITVAGYPSNGGDNKLFTNAFSSLNGTLAAGGVSFSQPMNAATHTTSIDIFDSLGAKHTLTLHFRKWHTSTNPNDPTVWKWYADVAAPATLDQPAYGEIKFNPDGSLQSFNPPTLIFNPNNGADPGQAIQLDLGNLGKFNGITSFEAPSSTSGETQDGYPGGDLQQLTVDQTGTIIGVFTNGRSYPLAQVAIAKFVNDEGLTSDGGTMFSASPNSGDPIIGTAGTGGRGTIQPSALEMSNVDLSRALTELIVIQRGFQANAKTITTSDQMLNTLLQLKQ